MEFQKRKQKFKAGKPCAVCGALLSPEKMMVAHLVPVRELNNHKALFNEENWQVRCIECEHKLHHEEQIRANYNKKMEDLKLGFLQNKRKEKISRQKHYRNTRSACTELNLRKLSHKPYRKRVHKHQKDDYYNEL